MAEYGILDFGPSVETRHIEAPIDRAGFAAFERSFRPLLDRRDEIHTAIPGAGAWPPFEPSREKVLEYYLTVEALGLDPGSTYLEVRYDLNHKDVDPSFYRAYSLCLRKGE